jgi:diguanylate cyclase (GGDEF)-like protein
MSPNELLYKMLQKRPNFIAASVKMDGFLLSAPFVFLTEDFAHLGFPGILTPNDLVEAIDPKSEICEYEGYKEYKAELRHDILEMSQSSLGEKILLFPLASGAKVHVYALHVFRMEEEGIIAFLLEEFDNAAFDIEKLFFSSSKDDLTGLFNLHTFYDHTKKNPRPLYCGLYDINHFKNVNDVYGHSKGDELLAEMGRRLVAISGPNEIYYHRSGDEFIYLSFVMDEGYQLALVEKIERELESIVIGDKPVSAAFGLVKIDHAHQESNHGSYDDRDALLYADIAMYEAKLAGKRLVSLSDEGSLEKVRSEGPLERTISRLAALAKR